MILGTFRFGVLGAVLVGLAAPSHAAEPQDAAPSHGATSKSGAQVQAENSRRVELPFPLDTRAPGTSPREAPRTDDSGPHPFREIQLKRAALTGPDGPRFRALSHYADFS